MKLSAMREVSLVRRSHVGSRRFRMAYVRDPSSKKERKREKGEEKERRKENMLPPRKC